MSTLGIDVSTWQGKMNWQIAADAGVEFAFIRAGSINYVTGIPYTDYQFELNAEEAPKHLKHIGFYWFWRANQDPIVQAKYFSDLLLYKTWDLAPVADVEASNSVSPSVLTSKLKIFLQEVETRTGKKPIIYTRASFWNIATTKPSWALAYDLWCARYRNIDENDMPDISGPWSDGLFKCYPWANEGDDGWEYFQYSADGNNRGPKYGAESPHIDLDLKRLPFDNGGTPPSTNKVEIDRDLAIAMYNELKSALGY